MVKNGYTRKYFYNTSESTSQGPFFENFYGSTPLHINAKLGSFPKLKILYEPRAKNCPYLDKIVALCGEFIEVAIEQVEKIQ